MLFYKPDPLGRQQGSDLLFSRFVFGKAAAALAPNAVAEVNQKNSILIQK